MSQAHLNAVHRGVRASSVTPSGYGKHVTSRPSALVPVPAPAPEPPALLCQQCALLPVARAQRAPQPGQVSGAVRRLKLWAHPAVLATLVSLLGLFWVGRKWQGLI